MHYYESIPELDENTLSARFLLISVLLHLSLLGGLMLKKNIPMHEEESVEIGIEEQDLIQASGNKNAIAEDVYLDAALQEDVVTKAENKVTNQPVSTKANDLKAVEPKTTSEPPAINEVPMEQVIRDNTKTNNGSNIEPSLGTHIGASTGDTIEDNLEHDGEVAVKPLTPPSNLPSKPVSNPGLLPKPAPTPVVKESNKQLAQEVTQNANQEAIIQRPIKVDPSTTTSPHANPTTAPTATPGSILKNLDMETQSLLNSLQEASVKSSAGSSKNKFLQQIHNHFKKCWQIPQGLNFSDKDKVKLKLKLNTLAEVYNVTVVEGKESVLCESAQNAIMHPSCRTVPFLETANYKQWSEIEITFNPRSA